MHLNKLKFPPVSSIDVHCHLLPGLDDGPADETTSVMMLRALAKAGYDRIIATPHSHLCHKDDILTKVEWANTIAIRQGIKITIVPGTEIMVTPDIAQLHKHGKLLTLAEKGTHLLIELQVIQSYPYYLPDLVFQLGLQGIQVIIAHPERAACFQHDPSRMEDLLSQNVLFQITASSFTGLYGRRVKRFAYNILKNNQVHLIATDAHSPHSRRLLPFQQVYTIISKAVGEVKAKTILYENPSSIWSGQHL